MSRVKIECDAIRLHDVIVGHDQAYQALRVAYQTTSDPVTKHLISAAMSQLSNAGGQLNWWRKKADDEHAAYLATWSTGNWLSSARIGYDGITDCGCGWIETEPTTEESEHCWMGPTVSRHFAIDMQQTGTMRSFAEMQAYVSSRGKDPNSIRINVDTFTPDDLRAAIIADGWPLSHATIQDHMIYDAQIWANVERKMREAEEARSGGQRRDETPISDVKPEVSVNHVWHKTPDGKYVAPIRIRSEGYGSTSDMTGDVESHLKKLDATVHYVADAIADGYVGTWTGQMQEVCYDLDGSRWYLYLITSSGIDDYSQEWWVSRTRLSANVAADVIEECRNIDRPLD